MKPLHQVLFRRLFSLLCCALAMAACGVPAVHLENIHERISIENYRPVVLNIDNSQIVLTNALSDDLILDGRIPSPGNEGFSIGDTPQELVVSLPEGQGWSLSEPPKAEITVQIPKSNPLSLTAFEGNLIIQDYEGSLNVHLVTGEIIAYRIKGEISLISPRGDIRVQGGEGSLRVLGEHGLLTLSDVHGRVGSSTIMGKIRLDAEPGAGDEIRLEADHGPIEVSLGKNADLDLEAQSNSGDLTCVIPGIAQDGRRCRGRLGNGDGTLWIRTVSGPITIQMDVQIP